MLHNHIWFLLCVQILLVNVTVWQAQSLVTTVVPWGLLVLSLSLKCVDSPVVDSKQKGGWIFEVCMYIIQFPQKFSLGNKKTFMVGQWYTVCEQTITSDLVLGHVLCTYNRKIPIIMLKSCIFKFKMYFFNNGRRNANSYISAWWEKWLKATITFL